GKSARKGTVQLRRRLPGTIDRPIVAGIVARSGAHLDIRTIDTNLNLPERPVASRILGLEPDQIVRAVLSEHLRHELIRRIGVRERSSSCDLRQRTEVG